MNHDATHCADYNKETCPQKCYRAELTEDLRRTHYPLPTSWAHFYGTKECPKCKDNSEKTKCRYSDAEDLKLLSESLEGGESVD